MSFDNEFTNLHHGAAIFPKRASSAWSNYF